MLSAKKTVSKFKSKKKKKPQKGAPFYATRQMIPSRRVHRRKAF